MISKRTPARMARLVAQWRASGESRAGFARRRHIPAWTFWYWCRKLSAESPVEADRPPPATFVPAHVTADADAHAIEVVFTSGERVHVRLDAPAELVRTVLTALRAPC